MQKQIKGQQKKKWTRGKTTPYPCCQGCRGSHFCDEEVVLAQVLQKEIVRQGFGSGSLFERWSPGAQWRDGKVEMMQEWEPGHLGSGFSSPRVSTRSVVRSLSLVSWDQVLTNCQFLHYQMLLHSHRYTWGWAVSSFLSIEVWPWSTRVYFGLNNLLLISHTANLEQNWWDNKNIFNSSASDTKDWPK